MNLFFIILFPFYLLSEDLPQSGAPFVRNFTPQDYSSHAQNWALAQDPRGIIYIGNGNGIMEYDGQHFRIFRVNNLSVVRSVAVDRKGTIFAGAFQEFGFLKPTAQGDWQYFSLMGKVAPDQKNFSDIWDIIVTSQGVYFGSYEKIFFYSQNQIKVIRLPGRMRTYQVNGCLFLCGFDGRLYKILGNKCLPLPHSDLNSLGFASVLPYNDQELMIISAREILLYHGGNNLFAPDQVPGGKDDPGLGLRRFPNQIADYLRANLNYKTLRLTNGNYAIGTMRGGVVIMSAAGRLVQVVNHNRGLQDDCVFNLLEDHSQNLWLALNTGISYLELSSPITIFDENSGLRGMTTTVIRHQGELYAGTFNRGVLKLPRYQLQLQNDRQYFVEMEGFNGYIWDFLPLQDHLLAAGTMAVDIHQGQAKIISGSDSSYCLARSPRFPRYIFLGHSEVVDGGLGLIEINGLLPSGQVPSPGANLQFNYRGKLPGIQNVIRQISVDGEGHLWLSTPFDGLLYIKFKGLDVRQFEVFIFKEKDGLPTLEGNYAQNINGRLLVASSKGIYRINGRPDRPLPAGQLRFILDEHLGKGFFEKNIGTYVIQQWGNQDYLVQSWGGMLILRKSATGPHQWWTTPFNKVQSPRTFWVDRDRVVWITGANGIYRYDPALKKDYGQSYFALIRRVSAGDRRVIFAGWHVNPDNRRGIPGWLQNQLDRPVLAYRENTLLFEYSAAYYEHGRENFFSCYLANFDKRWSDWNQKTEKEYTNLPEGEYTFQIKARNIYETESAINEFRFRVLPPWNRTVWAYLVYLIVFCALLYTGIRLYNFRLIRAKTRLEKIVNERTLEVVQQRDEIEKYASDLYSTNRQLTTAKNALWGEMELAKKIQTVLLPAQPAIPGYEIRAFMKPADEVGGDYYDVINLAGTHWLVIGDVSGHGVPAGLVMMMVQTALHTALDGHSGDSPEKILIKVNRILRENMKKLGEDKYMTITLLSVHEDGTFCFSGLHQDMMIYRTNKKAVELVETRGIWIGIMDAIEGMIGLEQFTLQPGDAVLLYTDGIPEATDPDGRMFSAEKLAQIFKDLGDRSPEDIKTSILASLAGYQCQDDITLMIIRRL